MQIDLAIVCSVLRVSFFMESIVILGGYSASQGTVNNLKGNVP